MIFYVFYLLFSFRENVEYAVSEHLESLKFTKKKKERKKKEMQGVSSQTLQGGLIVPPRAPQLCCAFSDAVQKQDTLTLKI